jgi:hypothetical protein
MARKERMRAQPNASEARLGRYRTARRSDLDTKAVVLFLFLLALLAGMASAEASAASLPSRIWTSPPDEAIGSQAGQLDHPESVAVSPSGHVLVTDRFNARVSEFDAWGEFVKAWGWGVATGAPALETCGPGATPPSTACQEGLAGTGAGQFGLMFGGIAVDSTGGVYVGDLDQFRVQKFDSSGQFLFEFGSRGIGPGQFETQQQGRFIAVGPDDTVFVGDRGRIEEFEPDGSFKSQISFKERAELSSGAEKEEFEDLEGASPASLAVDAHGDIWLRVGGINKVYKLSPAGEMLLDEPISIDDALTIASLAVDLEGNLYLAKQQIDRREVLKYDPQGRPVIPEGEGFAVSTGSLGFSETAVGNSGLATGVVTASGESDIYVVTANADTRGAVRAYGPAPANFLPPPPRPPGITAQYAASVAAHSAVLRGQINPRFWTDTKYYVEYGTGKCSEGGCAQQYPLPPGSALGSGIVSEAMTTKDVSLTNLAPATTYHYRFVAASGGGGPVRGVGGEVGADGAEGSFTTAPLRQPLPVPDLCPNAQFRTGSSALLPDCRAYEMVSPVDKNGGDIYALLSNFNDRAAFNQTSLDGSRLTYSSYGAFSGAKAAPYVSQYLASRGPDGWQNQAISPAQGVSKLLSTTTFEIEFRWFSDDLCSSVLLHFSDPLLAPGAVPGFANFYRRQNCGAEGYEALTTSEPPTQKIFDFQPSLQGVSADGRCAVFKAQDQLTADANPGDPAEGGSNNQVYESCGGQLRLVSALPNGKAATEDSSAGTSNVSNVLPVRWANVDQAVSEDGSRVYWSNNSVSGPGRLYLRINATQAQSAVTAGKCTEADQACTVAISGLLPGTPDARFWKATPDGAKALFTVSQESGEVTNKLYAFDLDTKTATLLASQVTGLMGASEDLSRIYFVSKAALDGDAVAGGSNLYLYDGGTVAFIGELSAVDGNSKTLAAVPSPVNVLPSQHLARVTADGSGLAFTATGNPTGYDNLDVASGKPDSEVYVYDAGSGKLSCASCNPTGARPSGRFAVVGPLEFWAGAYIPGSATQTFSTHPLSEDGDRLFFNSFDALLPRDTNGKADVYQWQAPGSGDCDEKDASYSASNGGCLSLISSGGGAADSEFVDATPDGSDVFFTTAARLLPEDPGQIDIYDARVGGGLPAAPAPAPPCEGEACQGPSAPPSDPPLASTVFQGAGNVVEKPGAKKKKARKKKALKKKALKKKHSAKRRHHRSAGHNRRGAR